MSQLVLPQYLGGGGGDGESPVIKPNNWDANATLQALKPYIKGCYNFGEAPVDDGGVDVFPNMYQGSGAWAGMPIVSGPGPDDQLAAPLGNGLEMNAGGGCLRKRGSTLDMYMSGPSGDFDIGTGDFTSIQFFWVDHDYGTGAGAWLGVYINGSNRLDVSVNASVVPALTANGASVGSLNRIIYGGLNMIAVVRRASECAMYLNGAEVTGSRPGFDADTGNLVSMTIAPAVCGIEQVYLKGHGASKAELDAVFNDGQMTYWNA